MSVIRATSTAESAGPSIRRWHPARRVLLAVAEAIMTTPHSHHNGTRPARARGTSHEPRSRGFARLTRLPGNARSAMKEHPGTTLAAVAAGSFVLGTLAGSTVGRLVLTAAAPFIVKRLLDGELGRDLAEYLRKLADGPGETHSAEA
jgi:hypothetical protein